MMRSKKAVVFTGIFLAISVALVAQKSRALAIGDTLPLQTIFPTAGVNGSHPLQEKNLEGKAILLNFWNIWCQSSWKGIPKLALLQQAFPNELVVVNITSNTAEEAGDIYAQLGIHPATGYSVTADTSLGRLFPHLGDPLHVWIDRSGVIRHITHGYNATREHMTAFLKGETLPLATRGNLGSASHPTTLLAQASTLLQKDLRAYSVFVSGQHEYAALSSPVKGISGDPKPRLRFLQATALDLFRTAFFEDVYGYKEPRVFRGNNRIQLAVADSTPFLKPTDSNKIDRWNGQYLYNYELFLPPSGKLDPYHAMQLDLVRYLPYTATLETRLVPCRVLYRYPTGRSFTVGKDKTAKTYKFSIREGTFRPLMDVLTMAYQHDPKPLISDISLDEPLSLFLSVELENFDALRRELRTQGLDIKDDLRPIKMLVIRDR